jgi:CD109 antigen
VLLPEIPMKTDLELTVNYDTKGIEVNDLISVKVKAKYTGLSNSTGMMLIDVGVPTGFTPSTETLDLLPDDKRITRYDIAGRKVIVYVNDLPRGEEISFEFKMIAKFPVKAQIPDSKAYSYYNPEVKGEVKGGEIEVK